MNCWKTQNGQSAAKLGNMYSHKVKAQTATPDKYPQGYFKTKPCRNCLKEFQPVAPSHLYCSDECFVSKRIDKYLIRNYGITYDWYKEQLIEQKHLCAICKKEGWSMKEGYELLLVVDHDHKTKQVRKLLCHNCNRGLGLFQDSIENLEAATDYLKSSTTIPQGSTPK